MLSFSFPCMVKTNHDIIFYFLTSCPSDLLLYWTHQIPSCSLCDGNSSALVVESHNHIVAWVGRLKGHLVPVFCCGQGYQSLCGSEMCFNGCCVAQVMHELSAGHLGMRKSLGKLCFPLLGNCPPLQMFYRTVLQCIFHV